MFWLRYSAGAATGFLNTVSFLAFWEEHVSETGCFHPQMKTSEASTQSCRPVQLEDTQNPETYRNRPDKMHRYPGPAGQSAAVSQIIKAYAGGELNNA
jgi:hypothetical protein